MQKKLASGFAWSYAERITAQVVSFVVSIVLARLLTPAESGTVSLVLILINICNVFVSSGFGSGLVQRQDTTEEDFSTVFWFSFAISAVLYVIVFIAAPLAEQFFDYPDLTPVIRVMALRIPFASINSIQHAYVSRKMIFKKFFFATLIGTVISAGIGIVLAIMGFGVWALVAQYLFNVIIDTLVLSLTIHWRPRFVLQRARLSFYFSYGWKILFASLVDTVYTNLRSFVIGKRYSSADLAYYNKGMQMPALIVNNVNSTIIRVMFPAFSREQDDKEHLRSMVKKSISTSAYILAPLLVGLFVIGKPLMVLLLTDKWIDAVPYLQIFCASYLFMPIHAINQQAIKATGRSDITLKVELIKKIFGISLIIICVFVLDTPLSLAISFLLYTGVALVINAYPGKKLYLYGWIEQVIDVGKPLMMSCLMAIIIYPLSYLLSSQLILVISQIVIGAIVYILVSLLLRYPVALQCAQIAKKKLKIGEKHK